MIVTRKHVKYITKWDKDLIKGRLRNVCLRGFDKHPIYSRAVFVRANVDLEDLRFCQTCVLSSTLDTISDIVTCLETCFHVNMERFWKIDCFYDENDTGIPFMPVIVENSHEGLIIADGAHRSIVFSEMLGFVPCIIVSGLPGKYPYYAYPNYIHSVDCIPKKVDVYPESGLNGGRKVYREKNYRDYYRDYDAVFPGIQIRR